MRLRRPVLIAAMAAAALSGPALAANVHVDASCEIDSDFDLTLNERSLILTRAEGSPKAIVMRQGRLFVDDRWVALSRDDARAIADYEKGARAAMPEAQYIGREAADIAFTALGEVAAVMGNHPDRTRAHIERARKQLDQRLRNVVTPTHFSGKTLGDGIADALGDTVPTLVGELVGGAVTAALSGDADRIKRLDGLDAKIEAAVQPRADALGRRAETLCQQMSALDAIDNALGYRYEGRPLELLRVQVKDARSKTAAAKP